MSKAVHAIISLTYTRILGDVSGKKNLPANAGDIRDLVSIPGSERSPGEGNGIPLQPLQ